MPTSLALKTGAFTAHRLTFGLLLAALAWISGQPTVAQPTANAPAVPTYLRTDFQTTPGPIDDPRPRFTWEIQTEAYGYHQRAYQVRVATSAAALDGPAGGLVWDSGRRDVVRGGEIRYGGPPLRPDTPYFWKVKVWDQTGRASAWSRAATWQTGLLAPENWQARWIQAPWPPPATEAAAFEDDPAPFFRKDFTVTKPVRRVSLLLSGLGYFEAGLNGQKVGDHELDPGWTDYRDRVYYVGFDLTNQVKPGANCLSVMLGNGWFNPLPLRMFNKFNFREYLPTGPPCLRAQLTVHYRDGTTTRVLSDESWQVLRGHTVRNNVYLGEKVDFRRYRPGWDRAGFRASDLENAVATNGPAGRLEALPLPPIRVFETLKPVSVRKIPGTDAWLADLGRNFGGLLQLALRPGRPGQEVRLRYGELVYPDGRLNPMTSVAGQIKNSNRQPPGAPRTAVQEDLVILDGKTDRVFRNRFTFHGFRYVEIEGYPGTLTAADLTGLACASDVPRVGTFRCSDSLVNAIQQASVRTFLSNLFGVQSDCPHRERLGYGGDIVGTSEALMANFDMAQFYRKTVRDFADAARPDGAFTETAPFVGIADEGLTPEAGSIGWGTVHPLLLDQLHRYYGDRALAGEQLPAATRWGRYLRRHAPDLTLDRDIGDHESHDPKSIPLTSTAFLFQNAHLLGRLHGALGDEAGADGWHRLADSVRRAFHRRFFRPDSGFYDTGTPANQAFALYFGLVPPNEVPRQFGHLVRAVEARGRHVTTGMFGTKFLPDVLARGGQARLMLEMVRRPGEPGWAAMLARGATTVWEHWAFSDNVFSHNHPMFGCISEWFFKHLGGIQPAPEAVAGDMLQLQPAFDCGLTFAEASHRSAQGLVASRWSVRGGTVTWTVRVPPNSAANLRFPVRSERAVRVQRGQAGVRGAVWRAVAPDAREVQLGSGRYEFQFSLSD